MENKKKAYIFECYPGAQIVYDGSEEEMKKLFNEKKQKMKDYKIEQDDDKATILFSSSSNSLLIFMKRM